MRRVSYYLGLPPPLIPFGKVICLLYANLHVKLMNQITDNLWVSSVPEITLANGDTPQVNYPFIPDEPVTESLDQFDHVVGLCSQSKRTCFDCTYTHYRMADDDHAEFGDSSYDLFKDAADTVYNALKNNDCTLVHCFAGQNRSVSVAAAALTRLNDNYELLDALNTVTKARPVANPRDSLMKKTVMYVNQHQTTTEKPPA